MGAYVGDVVGGASHTNSIVSSSFKPHVVSLTHSVTGLKPTLLDPVMMHARHDEDKADIAAVQAADCSLPYSVILGIRLGDVEGAGLVIGLKDGEALGLVEVGLTLGLFVGAAVGDAVGTAVGDVVGEVVGAAVTGELVAVVGEKEGTRVVGTSVATSISAQMKTRNHSIFCLRGFMYTPNNIQRAHKDVI